MTDDLKAVIYAMRYVNDHIIIKIIHAGCAMSYSITNHYHQDMVKLTIWYKNEPGNLEAINAICAPFACASLIHDSHII